MFNIEEITKRAQAAQKKALESMAQSVEKTDELTEKLSQEEPEPDTGEREAQIAQQLADNAQRQVEILGQVFSPETMAQMSVNEDMLRQMMEAKVAEAASMGVGDLMEQMYGEEMGVLAAALETLSMEDEEDQEEVDFTPALEEELYTLLEETMERIGSLPEPEPVPYEKNDPRWEIFGILLSGIVSRVNDHRLDCMDVEEHIPVMEQQVVSLVRRSWGIDGRGDLLEMIRYLSQEGYILRYNLYSQAASPQELLDEDADEEEIETTARAWRFAQRYKDQYGPGFMAGWDIGRAAMLTRWGCYLGWITESEAVGILWDLSQRVVEELHSWREFAQSYLFGGLMWKLLCGDSGAASYLGYLADAATGLLAGKPEENAGQWRTCPWPAQRKIGFTL